MRLLAGSTLIPRALSVIDPPLPIRTCRKRSRGGSGSVHSSPISARWSDAAGTRDRDVAEPISAGRHRGAGAGGMQCHRRQARRPDCRGGSAVCNRDQSCRREDGGCLTRRYGRPWQAVAGEIDRGRLGRIMTSEAIFVTSSVPVRDASNPIFDREDMGGDGVPTGWAFMTST